MGSSQRTVRTAAVGEALLTALPAVAVASAAYGLVARPLLSRVELGGAAFYAEDLWPGVVGWSAPTALTLTTAACVALYTSRRRMIDRREPLSPVLPETPRTRRLLLVPLGVLAFLLTVVAADVIPEPALIGGEALGLVLILLGIVFGGGAAVGLAAGVLERSAKASVSRLLAGRRLQRDPSGGFRATSGVALIAFVFAFAGSLNVTSAAVDQSHEPRLLEIEVADDPVDGVLASLASLDGVVVVPLALAGTGIPNGLVTTCAGVAWITEIAEDDCRAGTAVASTTFEPDRFTATAVHITSDGGTATAGATVVARYPDLSERVRARSIRVPRADYVVAVETEAFETWPAAQLNVIAESEEAELAAITTMALADPARRIGRRSELQDTAISVGTVETALHIVLGYAMAAALAALLLTIAETSAERTRSGGVARALALGADLRYRKTLWELGTPLTVAVCPTLVIGAALAYGAAEILSGQARLHWVSLAYACLAVVLLTGVGTVLVAYANSRADLNQPLKDDAV